MTVTGHVKNGQIVLDEAVPLAEGMKVRVELLAVNDDTTPDANIPSLYDRHKGFFGKATDLPEDLARNHDHYLHGLPKK